MMAIILWTLNSGFVSTKRKVISSSAWAFGLVRGNSRAMTSQRAKRRTKVTRNTAVKISNNKEPLPLAKLSKKICRSLKGIFSDIDDTITDHGKVTEDAFK